MKVFVASTYQDLLAYRAAATRSILMAGNLSEDMLYWPAEDSPPLDVSLRHLRSSHLVILLIAHQYGAPPAGQDRSITELEFDEALKLNLPVLAFQVDPDHPWPPRYMETEPGTRAQLDSFTQRVKAKVTSSLFSTPDSLEVAITHALTHFTGHRIPVTLSRYAEVRLQHVSRSESLCYSPDAIIKVGNAPDGAPLLLSVRRKIPMVETMTSIVRSIGKEPDDPVFSEIISQLNQEARTFATASGQHRASWRGDRVELYVPQKTMVALMSPTLFQSMLGTKARDADRAGRPSVTSGTVRSGHSSSAGPGRVTSLGGANRYLCIGLDASQTVWSGGWTKSRPPSMVLSRPFIEEGLERLTGVRYIINVKNSYSKPTRLIDTDRHEQAAETWVSLLTSSDDEELNRYSHEILVPRSSIMRFMLDVVNDVAYLHDQGQVHGDIKPSNTLVNRAGTTLIDEVGLSVGQISPTVTVGWSPYEQLLREPLLCAADIYPLGQMLLHILDGQPLGREVSYRMPDGQKSVVIDDPTIYINDAGHIQSATARKKWSRLIERALRTDHRQRWPNARAMGDELQALADQNDVAGHVSLTFPWGSQPSLAYDGKGEITMGWTMKYEELYRPW